MCFFLPSAARSSERAWVVEQLLEHYFTMTEKKEGERDFNLFAVFPFETLEPLGLEAVKNSSCPPLSYQISPMHILLLTSRATY